VFRDWARVTAFIASLEKVSALGPSFLGVVLGAMVLTALLRYVHPAARTRLRVAALLQVAGVVGLSVCAGLVLAGADARSFMIRLVSDASDVLLLLSLVTILGLVLFEYVLAPLHLRPPGILLDLVLAAAYVAATIIALGHLDRDVSSVLATGAIATAAVGFALQDTLRSVMGGMALQMDRTVRAGDWIRLDQIEGRVTDVRWRQTSIVTRDGDTVVIPNSHLATSSFTVIGKHGGPETRTRRWIYFEIDYDVPSGEVIRAVESALHASPLAGVARDPSPDCLLTDVRGAQQTLAVRYWLTDLRRLAEIDSAVRRRVTTALQRKGVAFSPPAQTVLLHAQDGGRRALEQEQELARRQRALADVSIFAPLTSEERRALAEKLVPTRFASGEVVTRKGDNADWLYILSRARQPPASQGRTGEGTAGWRRSSPASSSARWRSSPAPRAAPPSSPRPISIATSSTANRSSRSSRPGR
jgi:small-conductance mechanosensitive channel